MACLTDDCLYQIFFHAVQAPVYATGDPLMLYDIPPLNLSITCRSWNTVVRNNPSLWSYIHIVNPQKFRQNVLHPTFLHYVKRWLVNSNARPLSITFDILGVVGDPIILAILIPVLLERERWKDVCIHLNNAGYQQSVVLQCPPPLVSLDIFLGNGMDIQLRTEGDIPSRTLHDQETAVLNHSQPDTQHLPNLHVLKFYTNLSVNFDPTLSLLSVCPNLSILKIHDKLFAPPASAPERLDGRRVEMQTVLLPRLKELFFVKIGQDNSDALFDLIDHLTSPALQDFTFVSRHHLILSHSLRTLASFFSRCASHPDRTPVVKLKLVYPASAPSSEVGEFRPEETTRSLLKLLRVIPNLQQLSLSGVIVTENLIESLQAPPPQEEDTGGDKNVAICPSLSRLSLISSNKSALELATAEEMLISRSKWGKPLSEFTIDAPGFDGFAESSERVKALVKEGLVIS